MWACHWTEQETWWQRTWWRLSISSLPQSLLIRLAFTASPGPGDQWERLEQENLNFPEGASGYGIFKPTRHTHVHVPWWDASISADGADWCHCKATLDYPWKVTVIRWGFWGQISLLSSRRRIQRTKVWSASLSSLGRWWSKYFWKPFPDIWIQGSWLGVGNRDIFHFLWNPQLYIKSWPYYKQKLCHFVLSLSSVESERCLQSACVKRVPSCAAVMVNPMKDTHTFTDKQSTYNIGPAQSLDKKFEIIVYPNTYICSLKHSTEAFHLHFFLHSYN